KGRLIDSLALHRLAETAGLPFTGSLRRQGPIVQPLGRWRHWFCLRRNPKLHLVSLAPANPLAVDRVLAADELDIGRTTRRIGFERPSQGRDDLRRLAEPLGVEAAG